MKESTGWTWHILAAGILLFLLGTHMAIMHMPDMLKLMGVAASGDLDYAAVTARVKEVSYFIFYTCFLAVALYHGLYGLRGVVLELLPVKFEKLVTYGILFIGLFLFSVGTYARITVFVS